MAIPNNSVSGKDKSTPIGRVSNSLEEVSDAVEAPDDQSDEETSPAASDESED
jgi:hypothetical protein